MVIKLVRVKVLITLAEVMASISCGHGDDGPD